MLAQAMYSTELTVREPELGYVKARIENPQNRWGDELFSAEPQLLDVVVFKVNESDWVFKVVGPCGIGYRRMQYGVDGHPLLPKRPRAPKWHAVGNGDSGDPESAARAAAALSPEVIGIVGQPPPQVEVVDGEERLCYRQDQVPARDVARHNGVEVEIGGVTKVSFPILR